MSLMHIDWYALGPCRTTIRTYPEAATSQCTKSRTPQDMDGTRTLIFAKSETPSQGEKACIRGSEYILFEILD